MPSDRRNKPNEGRGAIRGKVFPKLCKPVARLISLPKWNYFSGRWEIFIEMFCVPQQQELPEVMPSIEENFERYNGA